MSFVNIINQGTLFQTRLQHKTYNRLGVHRGDFDGEPFNQDHMHDTQMSFVNIINQGTLLRTRLLQHKAYNRVGVQRADFGGEPSLLGLSGQPLCSVLSSSCLAAVENQQAAVPPHCSLTLSPRTVFLIFSANTRFTVC